MLKAVDEFVHMREITQSVKVDLKCLIAVVLVDVGIPHWTLKVKHLRPFSATFVLRMRRNGYLWTSAVNSDTAIDDPDFLLERKISAIWRRFPLIFFIIYVERQPYFYFRFAWRTDLESIPHASTPTSIIPTKFEDPTPIRCSVMSYNVSHWLPLKMRTLPLRKRQITRPLSRGSKTITFLESPTPGASILP